MAERFLEQVLPQLPEFPAFKCNVNFSPKIVEKYQVTSAPSFKLFVDGEVVQTLFGMRTPDDLYYTIKNYVKKEENYEDVWAALLKEEETKIEKDKKEEN
ncbi:thioredoxin family protein [Tepidibacillus sp. LV47]|uniref:thioredoxin family protein n=1 Tax=Tepidibacillus sp. LV47 TaxID=3398228 RepID=UPI003AABDC13